MIFSELYSAYYNVMSEIIKSAISHPLEKGEIRNIINEQAFGESILNIEPAILEERWQIVKPNGTSCIKNVPDMPLTLIQKRWLKAIMSDKRIRLFMDELPEYPDVKPLFTPDDYMVYDKYSDGDDYEDETYRQNFRLIMDAIRHSYPVKIKVEDRRGRMKKRIILPKYLEYSEKDDKFRLIAEGSSSGGTYNLGRIKACEKFEGDYVENEQIQHKPQKNKVVFELYDKRNALERVLLHFAHFEKEAEKVDEDKYKVTIIYDIDDEIEMVIRILSFGPFIKVIEPESFVNLIKSRLREQKSCGL